MRMMRGVVPAARTAVAAGAEISEGTAHTAVIVEKMGLAHKMAKIVFGAVNNGAERGRWRKDGCARSARTVVGARLAADLSVPFFTRIVTAQGVE
jgi:hypothetical protein